MDAMDARGMLYRAQIYLLKRNPKARDPICSGEDYDVRCAIRLMEAFETVIAIASGGKR